MNPTAPQVLLSAEGFTATATLVTRAEAKAAKLRRHAYPRIGHVRLHLRRVVPHAGAPVFTVSATAETRGPDLVAHSQGARPETAVNAAFTVLERAAVAVAGERKHRRQTLAPVIAFPAGT